MQKEAFCQAAVDHKTHRLALLLLRLHLPKGMTVEIIDESGPSKRNKCRRTWDKKILISGTAPPLGLISPVSTLDAAE
jgi:hypothetical protein